MKRRPVTSKEIELLRAYLAEPRHYGDFAALARTMRRQPSFLRRKIAEIKGCPAPRPNYSHPGVIIDDFGISHAQLMSELRDGTR